jgi:hypothetical protein
MEALVVRGKIVLSSHQSTAPCSSRLSLPTGRLPGLNCTLTASTHSFCRRHYFECSDLQANPPLEMSNTITSVLVKSPFTNSGSHESPMTHVLQADGSPDLPAEKLSEWQHNRDSGVFVDGSEDGIPSPGSRRRSSLDTRRRRGASEPDAPINSLHSSPMQSLASRTTLSMMGGPGPSR